MNAILNLRWTDVDFNSMAITWPADTGKMGKEWEQPIRDGGDPLAAMEFIGDRDPKMIKKYLKDRGAKRQVAYALDLKENGPMPR